MLPLVIGNYVIAEMSLSNFLEIFGRLGQTFQNVKRYTQFLKIPFHTFEYLNKCIEATSNFKKIRLNLFAEMNIYYFSYIFSCCMVHYYYRLVSLTTGQKRKSSKFRVFHAGPSQHQILFRLNSTTLRKMKPLVSVIMQLVQQVKRPHSVQMVSKLFTQISFCTTPKYKHAVSPTMNMFIQLLSIKKCSQLRLKNPR